MNDILKIAVIGDPNQGKSSFVSTLAYDDGIAVSSKSGETTVSSCHPLKINGEIVYELYDTPGFNNDEEVLNYIEENEKRFTNNYDLINSFIEKNKNDSDFSKDIEILKVLIKNPIIIYVANSSQTYNSNFDSSLEIIKKFKLFTFLIFNQKTENDSRDSWIDATNQYFIASFEFNVLNSNFNNKINLLKMLESKIENKNIKQQLNTSIKILNVDFKRRLEFSFSELSDVFYKIINYTNEYSEIGFLKFDQEKKEKEFINKIKHIENSFYSSVEKEWGFNKLNKLIEDLKSIKIDSENFTKILGVSKKSLLKIGVITGASAGGYIGLGMDVSLLGASAGIGTLLGTAAGAISGALGILVFSSLADKKTKGWGREKVTRLGPIKSVYKFPILAKMYFFIELISDRSHANREQFSFEVIENLTEKLFNNENIKEIAKILNEKDKEKFIKELKLILLENYSNRNNINTSK